MMSLITSCLHNIPGRKQEYRKRRNDEAFVRRRKETRKKHRARTRKKQEHLSKRLVFIGY